MVYVIDSGKVKGGEVDRVTEFHGAWHKAVNSSVQFPIRAKLTNKAWFQHLTV